MDFNNLTFEELDDLSVRNIVFDTKELSPILKAHLFIERLVDSLIEEKLTNPDSLFKNQISFSLKLDIAHSLGIIPDKLLSPIKGLNRIRNKYAHSLDYKVTMEELNSLKLEWVDIQNKAYKVAKQKGLKDAVSIACIFLCWSVLKLKVEES